MRHCSGNRQRRPNEGVVITAAQPKNNSENLSDTLFDHQRTSAIALERIGAHNVGMVGLRPNASIGGPPGAKSA